MAILTVAELRTHIESSLTDAALQVLLNATEELIVARTGGTGSRTEIVNGGSRYLAIAKRIDTITSIKELVGTTETTLDTDDYLILDGRLLIERLEYGTNPSYFWRGRVTVVYTPVTDDATRQKVQIDLCKLALNYAPGVASERIGDWQQDFTNNSAWNVGSEQEQILAQLDVSLGMVVI